MSADTEMETFEVCVAILHSDLLNFVCFSQLNAKQSNVDSLVCCCLVVVCCFKILFACWKYQSPHGIFLFLFWTSQLFNADCIQFSQRSPSSDFGQSWNVWIVRGFRRNHLPDGRERRRQGKQQCSQLQCSGLWGGLWFRRKITIFLKFTLTWWCFSARLCHLREWHPPLHAWTKPQGS